MFVLDKSDYLWSKSKYHVKVKLPKESSMSRDVVCWLHLLTFTLILHSFIWLFPQTCSWTRIFNFTLVQSILPSDIDVFFTLVSTLFIFIMLFTFLCVVAYLFSQPSPHYTTIENFLTNGFLGLSASVKEVSEIRWWELKAEWTDKWVGTRINVR